MVDYSLNTCPFSDFLKRLLFLTCQTFHPHMRLGSRERSLFTMSEHSKYVYKLDNGRLPKGITIIAGHL